MDFTAQVMEHARARGETAIGWLSGEGPLHLAPPALERNAYKDGDRIIVVRPLRQAPPKTP